MKAFLVICGAVVLWTGCHQPVHFDFGDAAGITFTNDCGGRRVGVVLGSDSKAKFIETVRGSESSFDPKFLELSLPMGFFQTDNNRFEYHPGLMVYRDGKRIHIWHSAFTEQLGQELSKTNESWKGFLQK